MRLPQQVQAAADAREQVVEVVRDTAGQLADGLHLLALPELLLGCGEAHLGFPLLGHVGRKLIGADSLADRITKRAERDLVMPAAQRRIAEHFGRRERLARQGAGPHGEHRGAKVGPVRQQVLEAIPDPGPKPIRVLVLRGVGVVDRQKAEILVDHLHEGVGGPDQFGHQPALGERLLGIPAASSVSLACAVMPRPP